MARLSRRLRRFPGQARLRLRIWRRFLLVRLRMGLRPLSMVVEELGASPRREPPRYELPSRLSRAVDRTLRIGPWQPTCLLKSLVLFRLLREPGDQADLVIGLPAGATDQRAHAWVELAGLDIGPPPGRGSHLTLARFR